MTEIVEPMKRVKIAFCTSLMNANAGMKWLDHDSMDEMIEAAWVGFEEPARAAYEVIASSDAPKRLVRNADKGPLRDPQRNPIEEANGYRDSVPEDDADALNLARGEIAWLREAVRRFDVATITVEQQAAILATPENRPWDQRFCPHQYYRHDDGSTDCPACARDAQPPAQGSSGHEG